MKPALHHLMFLLHAPEWSGCSDQTVLNQTYLIQRDDAMNLIVTGITALENSISSFFDKKHSTATLAKQYQEREGAVP